MSDLPACRVSGSLPAFTYTGVDYFGPFSIHDGRKEVKRYGVIFTCMASRAVHLEVANTLQTDTFINVLRRFVARRGTIKQLYSDNGTNFVGTERELRQALAEMDQQSIQYRLLQAGIDWIFNPPNASHMSGTWERMIRTVRKVLTGLVQEHGSRLDSDSFHTLLCEVEAIINSRPLTPISNEVDDLNPLTPNHILTGRTMVNVPPPGVFQKENVYMRKRWRRVQYLANLFWTRWKKEYLLLLQTRQKWNRPKRNLSKGDLVLLKGENAPRCSWLMARVKETYPDKNCMVRSIRVKTQLSELSRPIHKVVLLLPVEEQ